MWLIVAFIDLLSATYRCAATTSFLLATFQTCSAVNSYWIGLYMGSIDSAHQGRSDDTTYKRIGVILVTIRELWLGGFTGWDDGLCSWSKGVYCLWYSFSLTILLKALERHPMHVFPLNEYYTKETCSPPGSPTELRSLPCEYFTVSHVSGYVVFVYSRAFQRTHM